MRGRLHSHLLAAALLAAVPAAFAQAPAQADPLPALPLFGAALSCSAGLGDASVLSATKADTGFKVEADTGAWVDADDGAEAGDDGAAAGCEQPAASRANTAAGTAAVRMNVVRM